MTIDIDISTNLQAELELLRRRVAELEALVRDLQTRLGVHAGNSSIPPSANPPTAPKPVTKEPSGRAAGAQPGHAPCQRVRLPAERVQQTPARRHVCLAVESLPQRLAYARIWVGRESPDCGKANRRILIL